MVESLVSSKKSFNYISCALCNIQKNNLSKCNPEGNLGPNDQRLAMQDTSNTQQLSSCGQGYRLWVIVWARKSTSYCRSSFESNKGKGNFDSTCDVFGINQQAVDLYERIPLKNGTVWHISSITKVITSLCAEHRYRCRRLSQLLSAWMGCPSLVSPQFSSGFIRTPLWNTTGK